MIHFISVNFQMTPEYMEYCNCKPRCERTEYDMTVTSSVISKYAASALYISEIEPNNLAEIGRIQVSVLKTLL